MANIFKGIADGLSDFAGDISNAIKGTKTLSGTGKFLSYPATLGQDSDTIIYNSDFEANTQDHQNIIEFADAIDDRNNYSFNTESSEPFIMMEFYRSIEPEAYAAELKGLKADRAKIRGTTVKGDLTSQNQGFNAPRYNNKQDTKRINSIKAVEKSINDAIGKKILNKIVAMYMTPAISINDSMNYSQESRKTAAMWDKISNWVSSDVKLGETTPGGVTGEDVAVVSSAFATEVAGSLGFLTKGIIGGGLSGAGGNVVGDEALRRMGKALNPNEYMQYKNTALRTFSFQWKMLPDCDKESADCAEIIKIFRAASHANKKSELVLTIPDYIHVSFHGVGGMINLPPMVISSVGVTYNPNAASFFKQNNNPVEIDLSITLSEIVPIYRDDVEFGGL